MNWIDQLIQIASDETATYCSRMWYNPESQTPCPITALLELYGLREEYTYYLATSLAEEEDCLSYGEFIQATIEYGATSSEHPELAQLLRALDKPCPINSGPMRLVSICGAFTTHWDRRKTKGYDPLAYLEMLKEWKEAAGET